MDFTQPFGNGNDDDLISSSIMKRSREDDPGAFEEASPMYRIHENAPHFFVIQGERDTLVPVEEARAFVEKLHSVSSQSVSYAEIQGAQHAFDMFPSIRSEHTRNGVEKFLCWVYSQYVDNLTPADDPRASDGTDRQSHAEDTGDPQS
jgi:dipeptidyl aminopeptidase/acylaminoacyl peptidase